MKINIEDVNKEFNVHYHAIVSLLQNKNEVQYFIKNDLIRVCVMERLNNSGFNVRSGQRKIRVKF